MIFSAYELAMKAGGFRKTNTKDFQSASEERRVQAVTARTIKGTRIPLGEAVYKGDFILSGNHVVDQGASSACGCATIVGYSEDESIRETHNQGLGLNWEYMWDDMKKKGWASEKEGSFLSDNIYYMQTIGVTDNYGNRWVCDNANRISKVNIVDYLRMGYEIYTGAMIAWPMTDKNFVFRMGGNYGGHAFRLIGIRTIGNQMYVVAETTWKNYGMKKQSQFLITPQGISDLYTCYILTFKKS